MEKDEKEERKTIGEWIKELQGPQSESEPGRINSAYFRLKMFLARLYNLFKCLF